MHLPQVDVFQCFSCAHKVECGLGRLAVRNRVAAFLLYRDRPPLAVIDEETEGDVNRVWGFGDVGRAETLQHLPNWQIGALVNEALKLVGIESKAEMYPDELSGGEQQRVSIARAIVGDPTVLLADEPTGNLDMETSWDIMEVLLRINKKGTTVIMSTHNATIVDGLKQRVIELNNGRIVRDDQKGVYEGEAEYNAVLPG